MPNKTYVPGTVIDSPSLNDFNDVVYEILGDGTLAPATKAAARTNLGLGPLATATVAPIANGGTGDSGTAWTSVAVTPVPASGAFTSVAGACRYKTMGKTMWATWTVTITTNGTAAGAIFVPLPAGFTLAAAQEQCINGREFSTATTVSGLGLASGTSLRISKYDGTYPGGSGFRILIQGVLELL